MKPSEEASESPSITDEREPREIRRWLDTVWVRRAIVCATGASCGVLLQTGTYIVTGDRLGPHFGEYWSVTGILFGVPLSSFAAWSLGGLLLGRARRRWRVMVLGLVVAELVYIGPGAFVLGAIRGTDPVPTAIALASLWVPMGLAGVSSSICYLFAREPERRRIDWVLVVGIFLPLLAGLIIFSLFR